MHVPGEVLAVDGDPHNYIGAPLSGPTLTWVAATLQGDTEWSKTGHCTFKVSLVRCTGISLVSKFYFWFIFPGVGGKFMSFPHSDFLFYMGKTIPSDSRSVHDGIHA